MHETALVRDVVRRIEDLARATGARRVTGAKIWLGALSHLSEEHFREHFAIEAQGTRVDDLQETEDVHPEAHGVELYAPVHDYIYRASGRVAGSFPGVVEIQRHLAEMEFVQVERLHLEGNQPEIIR